MRTNVLVYIGVGILLIVVLMLIIRGQEGKK